MDGDAPIALLHHLPCSGGTIISRALAGMEDVALLSEVHPDMAMARKGNALKQAEGVYGLLTRDDVHAQFVEQIRLIHERAQNQDMRLVLRDHYGADFLSPDYERLTSRDVLAPHFTLRRAFTVRHPVDVWLGLVDRNWIGVPIEQYLERTLAASRHAAEAGFERYEDFVVDPDLALQRLCERLGIPFDASWRRRLEQVTHMTGASGRQSTDIGPRPRRPISDNDMARFRRSPHYAPILDMLGYPE